MERERVLLGAPAFGRDDGFANAMVRGFADLLSLNITEPTDTGVAVIGTEEQVRQAIAVSGSKTCTYTKRQFTMQYSVTACAEAFEVASYAGMTRLHARDVDPMMVHLDASGACF